MELSAIFQVVFKVLSDIRVIGALIAVVLYWSFMNYVLYYRKRPPKPKGKKKVVAAAAPAPAPAEGAPASEDGSKSSVG